MDVQCEKLRHVPLSQGHLDRNAPPPPPVTATHSMGGAETASTMRLACVLLSHLEEKAKVSGSSLSLGKIVIFSIKQEIMS